MEPLTEPPEIEEGDDRVAGGGTPRLVETNDTDLADTRVLRERDYEDDDDESDS
jgi:hypothetical protein